MTGAVDEIPKRSPWKRLLKLFLLAVIGLPLLGILGLNGWLASGWGRSWLAAKISVRTGGLAVKVAGASITPWSGVQVNGLVIDQPEPLRKIYGKPLVDVSAIRATPVWRAWLRGRMEVRSVDLDEPKLVVPLELLAHLGALPQPPVQMTPPPTVAVSPQPAGNAPQPAAAPATMPNVPAPAKPAPLPQSSPDATGWIRIHGGSLVIAVGGAMDKPVLALDGVNVDLPVAGAAADSVLRIAQVKLAGTYVIKPPDVQMRWINGELRFAESSWDLAGWNVLIAGSCGMQPGLPFVMQAMLPRQPGPDPEKCPWRGTKVGEGMAAWRVTGFARAPATWTGDFAAEAAHISLPMKDGHSLAFDSCGVLLSLRGGVMICRDARAVGDVLSLLGNAMVIGDGRAAAVLRVVLPPDAARAVAERTATACPGVTWGFSPLGAPDRVFADVTLAGTPREINISLGEGGSVLPLARAVDVCHVFRPEP